MTIVLPLMRTKKYKTTERQPEH